MFFLLINDSEEARIIFDILNEELSAYINDRDLEIINKVMYELAISKKNKPNIKDRKNIYNTLKRLDLVRRSGNIRNKGYYTMRTNISKGNNPKKTLRSYGCATSLK